MKKGQPGRVDYEYERNGTAKPFHDVRAARRPAAGESRRPPHRRRLCPGAQGVVRHPLPQRQANCARRPLMAFVMVLSYSRQIFLRFFLNARMKNFLRGHVEAFEVWPGVPKSSSTIISKALCWSAKVTSSDFIPPCSSLLDAIDLIRVL
jgi:transposase